MKPLRPRHGEPTGRVDFDRDYLVRGEDGRIIAKGVSKWCVIDLNSRKLVRAQDIVFPGEFCLEKTFEPPFAKLLPAETLPLAFEHTVRRSDLDHNGHMNNARYGELLLDAVPTDRIIRAFQIDFLHEAMRGETIAVHTRQNKNTLSVCGSIEHKPAFAHAQKQRPFRSFDTVLTVLPIYFLITLLYQAATPCSCLFLLLMNRSYSFFYNDLSPLHRFFLNF